MTEIELRFMQSVPATLKRIEEQQKRIADALEKLVELAKDE